MSVSKCWHLICHQQQSTTLFFLNHHHLWCPPTLHHLVHPQPPLPTTLINHPQQPQHTATQQQCCNATSPTKWAPVRSTWHDECRLTVMMCHVITVWLFSATLVSKQPPHPPTAYYPGAMSLSVTWQMSGCWQRPPWTPQWTATLPPNAEVPRCWEQHGNQTTNGDDGQTMQQHEWQWGPTYQWWQGHPMQQHEWRQGPTTTTTDERQWGPTTTMHQQWWVSGTYHLYDKP